MKSRFDAIEDVLKMLHLISLYKVLRLAQLYRFFYHKEPETVDRILRILVIQKRVVFDGELITVYQPGVKTIPDPAMAMEQAIWVLLDNIEHVTYHMPQDFPVSVYFITDTGLAYEIICVPPGQESALNSFFKHQLGGDSYVKRILIIEDTEQILKLKIPQVAGCCTVAHDGQVSYFNF